MTKSPFKCFDYNNKEVNLTLERREAAWFVSSCDQECPNDCRIIGLETLLLSSFIRKYKETGEIPDFTIVEQ